MNHSINVDSFWLPRAASTLAAEYDQTFWTVTLVATIFFLIIVGAMVFFVIKYRHRTDEDLVSEVDHSFRLELFWTAIPTLIVIALFVVGYRGYIHAFVAPAEALEIQGVGEKWRWTFTYPNGVTTLNDLKVPKGKPVRVVLSSKDVLHSFFIPEFRVKHDAVPGAYNTVWFEATELGKTVLLCTEYCGAGHSDMLASVEVLEEAKFNEWLEKGADDSGGKPLAVYGREIFVAKGCEACHTADGTPRVGPTMKGIFGRREKLTTGADLTVDENYLKESIVEPNAKLVAGFPPIMPPFKGLINDKQMAALIAYLKSLK